MQKPHFHVLFFSEFIDKAVFHQVSMTRELNELECTQVQVVTACTLSL